MTTTSAGKTTDFLTVPILTRRGFVKAGGALVVSLAVPSGWTTGRAQGQTPGRSLDPTRLASWLEINADNTILARTGRTETGTGMSGFYAQMIAEELRVRPEAISLVMGDTDATPDGGFSAGFLRGATNVRKVAAYTHQALLGLASAQLGVLPSALTVDDGVVTGGGRSISYGQLVQGQELELTIPVSGSFPRLDPEQDTGIAGLAGFTVTGDPALKPVDEYTVIGASYPVPSIADKVTAKTMWTGDLMLPGMLHARMIRPATIGSTVIAVGEIDRDRFRTAQVVRTGNLVAVLSPNEWEAVSAAQAVAAQTRWTDWNGLPGSDNLTQALRAQAWGAPSGRRGAAEAVGAALDGAAQRISATYEQPYVRHAPIGPYCAVADVRSDGTVTVWTHSAQSQGLRVQIANALGASVDHVVVKWLEQSGQYGRTTWGGDGAEADAAILSQLVGKPVRVQWTLQEDLAWSTVSPGWVADLTAGIDDAGTLVALRSDWYSPHRNDARLLGAVLAGRPTITPKANARVSTVWPYDKVAVLEQAYAMPNLGVDAAGGGLRGNIMRTPRQRQQTFAVESVINEAAAATGADPIEFRLKHTTNQRLSDIINATAQAAGWQPRPSPHPNARRTGSGPLTGRGMAVMIRGGGHWVGIAEVEVTPSSGLVRVTRFTMGVECGKVINPRQLKLVVQGGIVMGLSEALKEEVTFDSAKVTSTDWNSYKILTMEEMPEITIVQTSRDDVGFGTGGEAPNALPPPAVVAAFFDATGIQPHRIPLTPAYVRTLLDA